MSGPRSRYTREFKIEAIRRIVEDGQSQKQVADDLGINVNTLGAWKRQLLADPVHAFPGNGNQKPEDAELTKLRKENAALKRENSFLKKAAAYFAKDES